MPILKEKSTSATENCTHQKVLDYFCKHSRKTLVATLIIVGMALTATFAMLSYFNQNKDVIAVVGNKKITTKDYNLALYGMSFSGTPDQPETKLSDEERQLLINRLIDSEVIKQKAQELNITVSQEEINKVLAASLETNEGLNDGLSVFGEYTDKQKELATEGARVQALTNKIKETQIAWLEGKFLLVRFDKYNTDLPEEIQVKVNEDERANLKAGLKKKAEEKARELKQKLTNGEDFYAVRDELARDLVLGYPGIAPQTPRMDGEVNKVSYFEELRDLAQFKEFNEKAIGVNNNSFSDPFLIKNDEGKELDFYIVYQSINKKDGYRWGFENWLYDKKVELMNAKKISSVVDSITPKAYAFTDDVCGTSGYGHAYCFQFDMYYYDRSSNKTFIPNYQLKVDTGSVNAVERNGSSIGKWHDGTDNRWVTSTTSNGKLYFSYKSGVSGEDNTNDYINCNKTTRYRIYLTEGDPSGSTHSGLANTIPSLGYWTNSNTFSTNSWLLGSGGIGEDKKNDTPFVRVCLNNDTNAGGSGYCTSTEATGWANGGSAKHNFRWYPHWNDAPTTQLKYPAAGEKIAATTSSVNVRVYTGDQNSDDTVQTAIGIQKKVNGSWTNDGTNGNFWLTTQNGATNGTPGWSPLRTRNTEISFPKSVTAGTEYRYCAKSRDSHSAVDSLAGNDSGGNCATNWRYFSVAQAAEPTCSFSQDQITIDHGVNNLILSYSISNATSASMNNGIGNVLNTTSRTISPAPTSNTTYTITLNNGSTCSASVAVNPPKSLSCSVDPTTGFAPLTVMATTNPVNFTADRFDYNMGDGTILTGRPLEIYYTYGLPNTYNVQVRHPEVAGNAWQPCNPTNVQVNSRSGGSGGEVAP